VFRFIVALEVQLLTTTAVPMTMRKVQNIWR
jgi:hypothetical protein